MGFKRVLITGTTSGLGRAFHAYYASKGVEVVEVNRRAISTESELPVIHSEVLDITNPGEVYTFMHRLSRNGELPDLFILNAGINLADNTDIFDYQSFAKVMNINYMGVMNFVGAIRRLHLQGKTIATISSTSNIIPNPGHIGYHISKWALKRSFELLGQNDSANEYKSVVLGPVHTNISANFPAATGLQKVIFDTLAVSPENAANHCARFFEGRSPVFNFPKTAFLFYYAVKALLLFFPFLYKGTKPALKPAKTLA